MTIYLVGIGTRLVLVRAKTLLLARERLERWYRQEHYSVITAADYTIREATRADLEHLDRFTGSKDIKSKIVQEVA